MDGAPWMLCRCCCLQAIFGRNWGCHPLLDVKHLHFEMCYYQVGPTS